MHVFVTGATGFVGSAVVRELIGAGHRVIGLARSEEAVDRLAAAGAEAHRGDLDDLESLRRGAARAEGVIHTAFNHDFSTFAANCEADRRVIEAIGEVLADGSSRPFVITSGTGILQSGEFATEQTLPGHGPGTHPRVASEHAADAVAARGVPVAVVRLPPSVHGDGDHGFVPRLIAIAREQGVSAYPGDGSNRWPAVHRLDAATLFRLALERGEAARYHAVQDEGVPFREIAAVIGRRLGVPVEGRSGEAAAQHFGWFAPFAAMNVPASSRWTRERLGWQPGGPGLLEDLDDLRYFGA